MEDHLKSVESLEEEGNTNSESIKTLFNKLESGKPKRFSDVEIRRFTNNLTSKVGSGGFSVVYKGEFPDGMQIAVKVLGEKDVVEEIFIAEVSTIAMTSHRNLVKLYGYCFDDHMKALVYEYMENGSLDKILFKNQFSMEWENFYRIAIETARALSYLHEGCDVQIIHHDIKPSNVLLDSNLSSKVTDFGLAMLKNRDVSHVTLTRIRGTPGYGAPEMWTPSSQVTEKCDVYSFGMMLFEILGMRSNTQSPEWFPNQVWEKFADGQVKELIKECGIRGEDREKAEILTMVALWCAQFTPQRRPSMSIVTMMLEKKIPVTKPPNPFPSQDTENVYAHIKVVMQDKCFPQAESFIPTLAFSMPPSSEHDYESESSRSRDREKDMERDRERDKERDMNRDKDRDRERDQERNKILTGTITEIE